MPPLKGLSAVDLFASAVAPNWLIRGFLPERSIVLVSGDPGTSKTFLGLEAAISCATDKPFMGHFQAETCRTIFLGEDSPDYDVVSQTRKLLNGKDLHPADIRDIVFIIKQGASLNTDALADEIGEAVERYEAGLVVLDNLRSIHDLDENDSQSMHFVTKRLDRIRERTGSSILVLHHNAKPGLVPRGPEHRYRGSTAIQGRVDGHLSLSYSRAKNLYTAEVGKSRSLAFERFEYEFSFNEDEARWAVLAEGSNDPSLLLALFSTSPTLGWRDLVAAVEKAHPELKSAGATSMTYRILSDLKAQGLVHRVRKGEYALTDQP